MTVMIHRKLRGFGSVDSLSANNLGERIKRTSMDWFERSSADGRGGEGSRKLAPFETMHEEEKKRGRTTTRVTAVVQPGVFFSS